MEKLFPQFHLAYTECALRYLIIHTKDKEDYILFMKHNCIEMFYDAFILSNNIKYKKMNTCINTLGSFSPICVAYPPLILTDFVTFGSSMDDILCDISEVRMALNSRQMYKEDIIEQQLDKIEKLITIEPNVNTYMGNVNKYFEYDTMHIMEIGMLRDTKLDKSFLFNYIKFLNAKNRLQYHILKEIFIQHDTTYANVSLFNIVPGSALNEDEIMTDVPHESNILLYKSVNKNSGKNKDNVLHSGRLRETCTKQLMKIGDRYIFLGDNPKFGIYNKIFNDDNDIYKVENSTSTTRRYESALVDNTSFRIITALIPRKYRNFYWHLIFDNRRDGNSFFVLKSKMHIDNTVLILKAGDMLIGCFTSQQWTLSHVHYGNPDTFVFRLKPTDQAGVFTWSGRDDNIQLMRTDLISVGSGPCLAIDNKFNLTCRKSKTFNCSGLIPGFQNIGDTIHVSRVELWHLDPCETI